MRLLSLILLTVLTLSGQAQQDTIHIKNMDSIPITVKFTWANGAKDGLRIADYASFTFQTLNAGGTTGISVQSKRGRSRFLFHPLAPGYYILSITWSVKRKAYYLGFRPHMEGD